jgi:acetyl esterase
MAVSRSDLLVATQHRLARAMDAIPASVARRIAGSDRDADGMELDPHLAMILRLGERAQPDRHGTPVDEQRAAIRESSRVAAGPPIAVGAVRDLTVDGAEGPLRARLYSPAGSTAAPRALLVFFHGGGWVVGDLDTHDQPCRLLCRYAEVHVLSVDYRLAPEHPAPAAAHDALAAYRWALANAGSLGADPTRVAVGGDSAGGNLAAVVAQQARNAGIQAPLRSCWSIREPTRAGPTRPRTCSPRATSSPRSRWTGTGTPTPPAPRAPTRGSRRCAPTTCQVSRRRS